VSTRPPERDDLDALLVPLLEFAQEMLRKHGEYLPFGNVMTTNGDIELVAGYTGSEQPPSQDVIDLLLGGARSRAATGEIRAAGICYDVRLRTEDGKPTDAIAVSLEHRAGDAVQVLLPYSKGRFTGLRFGDLTAGPGEQRIFETG
jgi:hypothetical protein